jgi:hypothetical protein
MALVGCAAVEGLNRYKSVDDLDAADPVPSPSPSPAPSPSPSSVGDPPVVTTPPVPSSPEAGIDGAACAAPRQLCSIGCIDTTLDANNCGTCGHVCPLGERCSASACTTAFTTGLLGYWSLDEVTSANVASDSSPNNLAGKLVGSVVFAPGQGKRGTGAASFPGSGYIDVSFPNDAKGDGTGLSIPQGNVTYAMWIKTSSAAVQGLQVVLGSTWGGGCDRVIGNGAPGPLNYNAWNEENVVGKATVNDGNWHHVAYVMDKANGLLAYVDGVLDASDPNPTACGIGCSSFDWASEYYIGSGTACRYSAGDFTGLIDDVRLYDHVLDASQVAALVEATR